MSHTGLKSLNHISSASSVFTPSVPLSNGDLGKYFPRTIKINVLLAGFQFGNQDLGSYIIGFHIAL